MDLIKGVWYWVSDPNEGDIFHPVFIVDDNHMLFNGKYVTIAKVVNATFDLAVMPTRTEV
jgi:hypothetical protein